MEKTIETNFLFWFSLKGGCESPNFVFIRSICIGWTHGQNNIFCLFIALVCKVVVEVQRSSIIFIYMDVPHVRKLEVLQFYHHLS
jgi:hypothetical protein